MKRINIYIITLLICGYTASVSAQQEEVSGTLSLSQCRELALKANKDAASSRELSKKDGV
jgi:hypothetical protein